MTHDQSVYDFSINLDLTKEMTDKEKLNAIFTKLFIQEDLIDALEHRLIRLEQKVHTSQ